MPTASPRPHQSKIDRGTRAESAPRKYGLGELPPQRESSSLAWAALMAATALVSLWSWLRTAGSPMADVVEYLERALAFSRGAEVVDAAQLRAAGVTLLHVPAIWLVSAVGIEDTRWVLPYAATIHIGITCLFVAASVRLARAAADHAGASGDTATAAGWLAGILCLASPTLLQYSAIPMTDIAAGAALAVGMERALFAAPSAKRGAQAGLFLGVAVLAAYKCIPLVIAIVGFAAIGRWLSSGFVPAIKMASAGAGVLIALLLVQCSFDAATYGEFGVGLKNYVLVNTAPTIASFLHRNGMTEIGARIYQMGVNALDAVPLEEISRDPGDITQLNPATWYFQNFRLINPVWTVPAFAIGAGLAAAKTLVEPRAPSARRLGRTMLAAAPMIAAFALVVASATKGKKEMRIWLPMLPVYVAFTGYGLTVIAGAAHSAWSRPRAALVALMVISAPLTGLFALSKTKGTAMHPFAKAAEWLSEYEPLRAAHRAGAHPRVAASYNWSVLFRTAPHLELVKLPNQFDGTFKRLRSAKERAPTLEALASMDAVIVHYSLLRIDAMENSPETAWARELMDVLAGDFHVAAAFWDRENEDRANAFGPVLVLLRDTPAGVARRPLTSLEPAPESPSANPSVNLPVTPSGPPLVRMERPLAGIVERIDLAEARAWRLPGDGLVWLELAFDQRGPEVIARYLFSLRIADETGRRGFTIERRPRWNKRHWKGLPSGMRLREGFILAPEQGPMARTQPPSPLGPTGEAWIFLDLATVDRNAAGDLFPTGRVEPLDPSWRLPGAVSGAVHAERDDILGGSEAGLGGPGGGVTDDGFHFSGPFGQLRLGRLLPKGHVPLPGEGDPMRELPPGYVLQVEGALLSQ